MHTSLAIKHDFDNKVFFEELKTGVAYLKYERPAKELLDLRRTFVPFGSRHIGIASRLAKYVLDYALAGGYRVIVTCPFVSDFIEKHPTYRQALDDKDKD